MGQQIQTSEVRKQLSDLIGRAYYGHERFVIHRTGRPMAALIGIHEYEAILPILEDLEDTHDAQAALAEYEADPTSAIDWEAYLQGRRNV